MRIEDIKEWDLLLVENPSKRKIIYICVKKESEFIYQSFEQYEEGEKHLGITPDEWSKTNFCVEEHPNWKLIAHKSSNKNEVDNLMTKYKNKEAGLDIIGFSESIFSTIIWNWERQYDNMFRS